MLYYFLRFPYYCKFYDIYLFFNKWVNTYFQSNSTVHGHLSIFGTIMKPLYPNLAFCIVIVYIWMFLLFSHWNPSYCRIPISRSLIQHNIKSYHISNIYIIYYVIELMIWQKAINYQALISFSHLFPNRLFVRQLTNLKSKIINLKSIIHFLFYISVEKVQLRVFFHRH